MAIFSGREVAIGFFKEAVRGTWATPTYWIPRVEGDMDDQYEIIEDNRSFGTIDDVNGAAKNKQWMEGAFTGNLGDTTFGLLLKALFGTSSISGAIQSVVYEHTFTVQTSAQHPSLAITKKDPVRTLGFTKCMITSMEIECSADDYVRFTVGFRGLTGATQTATVSYTSDNLFTRSMTTLVRATTLSGLASGTAVNVKSFKVTFTPNVVDDDILGSASPNDFYNTNFRVEAEFDLKYEDDTFHDFVKNQTATYYRLLLTNPLIIGSSENPSLQLDFVNCKQESWARTDENNEIVGQSMKIVPMYNATDTFAVRAILTNLRSTVY
jgi:hypothetical protein